MPNPRAQRPLSLQAVTEDIRSLAQPAQAMLDMLAGAAKGSVSATVGIPGDIESLGRGIASAFRAPSGQRLDAFATGMEQPTVLPTTENVSAKLPAVVPTTAPLSRQHSAGYGQTMGEFIPTPGSGRVVQGGLNAIKSIPAAVQHGAQEFAKASAMGVPHVVKPKGGNWLTGDVESRVGKMKMADTIPPEKLAEDQKAIDAAKRIMGNDPTVQRTIAQMENEMEVAKRNNAINKWIDSNLTNYIKKEMATPEDPVRKLAEQGITHKSDLDNYRRTPGRSLAERREAAGFPAEGLGESELARVWENLADYSFMSRPAKDVSAERYPWVSKLDPETPVYGGIKQDTNQNLNFDHIVDVLRQDVREGRIRPEQLSKVSMEQAVRRTYEYDQEMAKKMAEAQIKATEGMPVHKDYPEGYKWIELKANKNLPSEDDGFGNMSSPGYEDLEKALKYEGETMGHCVGGYCDDVYEGRSRIYSLRDAKGEPHVTVEVQPHNPNLEFAYAKEKHPELLEKYRADKNKYNNSWQDFIRQEAPHLLEDTQQRIVQIKGKQNRAPKDEYLPYVQDFVKGGEWSDIGDFRNTGLVRQDGQLMTPAEHADWLLKQLDVPPEGMKRGGKVSISDNPDTMMIDVEDKRYDKGGEIKATPRSEGWGMAADLIKAIEGASKEQFGLKNPATEEIANFLMIPELARTLERKAYGQPITNIGKANVPLIPEDTSGALEAVAPLTGLARKGAKAVGKAAASEIEKAMFGESRVGALNAMTPQVMSVYKPHTPKKPDPEVGSRYKTEHVGNLAPKKEFNIEKEQGSSLMSNPWDLTSRGEKVLEVSDVPLVNPIITEGGHDFARDLGHIDANIGGASGEQIAQRMQDRVNDAYFANMLEKGTGRVFTMPSTMDITASNYSTMPVDIVMDLMSQANLKSKDIDKITNDIKTFMFEGEKGKFKNIAPVNTPEFSKQLREGGKGFSAGDLRKGVMDRLSKSEYQKMIGFNIEDVYGAIHDPTLKGYPKGYVGNTMIETVPFADLQKASHGSYDTANAGKYAGAMPSMPLELATPDLFEYFEKMYLANPKYQKLTPNQLRTMIVNTIEKRGSVISQPINQRVVDNVMRYKEGLKQGHFDPKDYNAVMDFMRRTGGYKDGGEVHGLSTNDLLFLQSQQDIGKMRPQAQREYITNMGGKELRQRMELKRANGGEITADDLTIEERPL